VVVGVPTMLATIYFGLLASDIYISESRFSLRSAKSGSAVTGLAAILSSPIVSSSSGETMVVIDYAKSQDMLSRVSDKLDLREHFSSSEVDVLSRLDQEASQEELLEHFNKHISLLPDPKGSRICELILPLSST